MYKSTKTKYVYYNDYKKRPSQPKNKTVLQDSEIHKNDWNRNDAETAIEFEEQFYTISDELLIKFPDQLIDEFIVKNYSTSISEVNLNLAPVSQRFCTVKLKSCNDIEAAIKEISKIRFGTGKLFVQKFIQPDKKLKVILKKNSQTYVSLLIV